MAFHAKHSTLLPHGAFPSPTSANRSSSLLNARSSRRKPFWIWTSGYTQRFLWDGRACQRPPICWVWLRVQLVPIHPSLCQQLVRLLRISQTCSTLPVELHRPLSLSMGQGLHRPKVCLPSSPWIHPDLHLTLPQPLRQDALLTPWRPRTSSGSSVDLQLHSLLLLLALVFLPHALSANALQLTQANPVDDSSLCHWCSANSFFHLLLGWKQRFFLAQVLTQCRVWVSHFLVPDYLELPWLEQHSLQPSKSTSASTPIEGL